MSWPPTAPGTEAKPAPGFVASTAEVVAAEIRPIMQPAEAARMASAALRMDFLPEGGGTLAQTRWAFDGQPPTRPASLRSLSSGRASRGPGGSYAGRPPHKGEAGSSASLDLAAAGKWVHCRDARTIVW